MALAHSLTLDNGITCDAAYTRISSIRHNHTSTIVDVQTWASKAARDAELATVNVASYTLPWNDSVSLSSAYTTLLSVAQLINPTDI